MSALTAEELERLIDIVGPELAERLDGDLAFRIEWEKDRKNLPDAKRLQERRERHEQARAEMVAAILHGRWGQEEKIMALVESNFSSRELLDQHPSDSNLVEAAIAVRAIQDRRRTRLERMEVWLARDHRLGLVDHVLSEWIALQNMSLENITISDVGSGQGARLLEVLRILLDTFSRETGRKPVGNRTISNWVRGMKREPEFELKLAVERKGKS